MADPTVIYHEGRRVVITDEHRQKAREEVAKVEAHNQRVERQNTNRYNEDIDSITKATLRKELKGTKHFIVGKGR